MDQQRQGKYSHRRTLYFLWDLSLVVGAVLALTFSTVTIFKLHQYRPAVARIASSLVEQRIDRVALPISMRPEVPQLLEKGITPVLYDPIHTAAQQFSLLNVTYKIQGDPPSLTRLDLDTLCTTPISPGRSIREEFSRPYIYSPIQPSYMLTPETPLERSLFLFEGRYELSLEVAHRKNSPPPTISVLIAVGDAPVARASFVAKRVVFEPTRIPFEVPSSAGDAELTIETTSAAYVHAWQLEAK
jgi:hypothetical protein